MKHSPTHQILPFKLGLKDLVTCKLGWTWSIKVIRLWPFFFAQGDCLEVNGRGTTKRKAGILSPLENQDHQ